MNNLDDFIPKLKPCPFCGGEADLVKGVEPRSFHPQAKEYYIVQCNNCNLMFGFDLDYGGIFWDEKSAIEAWNNRSEE